MIAHQLLLVIKTKI